MSVVSSATVRAPIDPTLKPTKVETNTERVQRGAAPTIAKSVRVFRRQHRVNKLHRVCLVLSATTRQWGRNINSQHF